jgi:outer membrane beta-barrel protein
MKTTALTTFLLCLLLLPSLGAAQSFDASRAPVLKKAKEWRHARNEITLTLGDTLTTDYYHNLLVNAGYDRHLTNWLSLGAALGYALPIKTTLAGSIEEERGTAAAPYEIPATHLGLTAEGHISVVPLYGKQLWRGKRALAYDLHLTLGAGVLQTQWNSDATVNADDEFLFAPSLGGGFRLFIKDNVALRLEVRDHLVRMTTHADRFGQAQDPRWEHLVMLNLGISVFIPSEVVHEE